MGAIAGAACQDDCSARAADLEAIGYVAKIRRVDCVCPDPDRVLFLPSIRAMTQSLQTIVRAINQVRD
ncbi:MAG: hypothetical protein AAGA40_15575, partial [Cyanobacteria bacterium P01_E01_bin.45]